MKKVVLFIVEGSTDKTALENYIRQFIVSDAIVFDILGEDVTTVNNQLTILRRMENRISSYMRNRKRLPSDLIKIVHLVDTDGCGIDPANIIEEDRQDKYFDTTQYKVPIGRKSCIEQRNTNKIQVLKKLIKTTQFLFDEIDDDTGDALRTPIPYEIYYFSCNMEHVAHSNPNIGNNPERIIAVKEKTAAAREFSMRFCGSPNEKKLFIDLLDEVGVGIDYHNSWTYILKKRNALERKSNFNVFFARLSLATIGEI